MNNQPDSRFAQLFKAYANNRCNEAERTEFMHMLTMKRYRGELQGLIDNEIENAQPEHRLTNDRADQLYEKILEEVGIEKNTPLHTERTLLRSKKMWWAAAAATVLILFSAGAFFMFNRTTVKQQAPLFVKSDVAPGGNKAMLTLSDGRVITLDTAKNGKLAEQGSTQVVKLKSGQLAYQSSSIIPHPQFSTNLLTVPRGGEYQLTLSDGTKVWLNSSSSITFPTAFAQNERRVEITGEAYFEVAKNPAKPFIVKIKDRAEVKVLGTHFNISAYTDEPTIKTTLLEGRVQVSSPLRPAVVLAPGQQVSLSPQDISTITGVDTDEVIAWKNGLFQFNSRDLSSIMQEISRWYDVEVVYPGAKPNIRLSGIISRNVNLSSVLKMLDLSGVTFKVEGKVITVMP